ncbi:hypothetical protein [Flagellimonas pelagia]|uniref:Uncharacterized protein n=2 Tax=Flagellimonas pelagia TaxID=2306998 RepID=A0ABY3KIL5_9FLAO|nr:hypothetical protein [Allomuricauda maritima]TXJ95850.1 hypothetical protein FQ017_08170 [Allomuricauda maritima]
MKKSIFITILMGLLSVCLMSAQQKKTTGHLVKNRKPWKNPKPQATMLIKNHDHKSMTGPLAKNRKPGVDLCKTYPIVFRERRKLTGPLAKNTRPEHRNYWEPEEWAQ